MGVASAVISFNDRSKRLLDVTPGHFQKFFATTRTMPVFPLWKINQLLKQKVNENDCELFEWALQMQMKLKKGLHMVLASSRTSVYTRNRLYKHLIIVVHLVYREYFPLEYYS